MLESLDGVRFTIACVAGVIGLAACGAQPPEPLPPPTAPCPTVAEAHAAPTAPAPTPEPPAESAEANASADAGAPSDAGSDASSPTPPAIGAAKGGPRGVRRCEFRESVDTYSRTCTIKQDADGALVVTAPGTALNPKNGFSFRMGGGPNAFDVSGQLDAFGLCRGPFSGRMVSVLDGATRTYEVRFRDHCMIVVR